MHDMTYTDKLAWQYLFIGYSFLINIWPIEIVEKSNRKEYVDTYLQGIHGITQSC